MEKLGFSYDWKKYTLCEAMYSHFQLFGAQPAIFCNVLDPGDADMRKPAQSKAYDVAEHRVTLPLDATHEGLKVTSGEGESAVELKEDEDYTLFYDEDKAQAFGNSPTEGKRKLTGQKPGLQIRPRAKAGGSHGVRKLCRRLFGG